MKNVFLCKRGRPDIEVAVSFLSGRVNFATEQDRNKLCRLMNFLVTATNDVNTLEVDDSGTLHWYIYAAFAVHEADVKSQNGSMFTLGKGSIINGSSKQKKNARTSAKSELNAVDERLSHVSWTKKIIEHQDFKIKLTQYIPR